MKHQKMWCRSSASLRRNKFMFTCIYRNSNTYEINHFLTHTNERAKFKFVKNQNFIENVFYLGSCHVLLFCLWNSFLAHCFDQSELSNISNLWAFITMVLTMCCCFGPRTINVMRFWYKNVCFLDINECVEQPNICPANSNCNNFPGLYNCVCHLGYGGATCIGTVY
jgi:hypothetical protein